LNKKKKRQEDEEKKRRDEVQKRREEERRKREDDMKLEEQRRKDNEAHMLNLDGSGKKLGFGLQLSAVKLNSNLAGFVPEMEEEEEGGGSTQVRKKVKLQSLDEEIKQSQARKLKVEKANTIIEQIPTQKEALFAFAVDWTLLDEHAIVESKMKPWVTKKIVEYLGEEEKTLTSFILGKLTSHMNPTEILSQLALVLDEDAEAFVVKLWRMLIFEQLSIKIIPFPPPSSL